MQLLGEESLQNGAWFKRVRTLNYYTTWFAIFNNMQSRMQQLMIIWDQALTGAIL